MLRRGLRPDEVPAVLRRGEEVLTEADPRHRANAAAGAGAVSRVNNITVNVPQGTSRTTANQVGARVAQQLGYAARRNN